MSRHSASMDLSPSWTPSDDEPVASAPAVSKPAPQAPAAKRSADDYVPFTDTLRLYAGWLLAWYVVIYAAGSYQATRALPFSVPVLEELFFSPLILHFAVAAYMFLLFSSIHRLLGRGKLLGAGMWVAGILCYLLFRSYA